MKDKDEFLEQMENLQIPGVSSGSHQNTVKMAIMNAGRSAALGVWLIILPCYFLLCVFMFYNYHLNCTWFFAMYALISRLDNSQYISFLGPLLLVILPLICIVINALAITHVQFQSYGPHKLKEFTITIKIKIWNILLILLSIAIVLIFIAYVAAENITIKN